ncbi:MAG TPA: MFS transporter, partial [Blastocatellia bacterium]|nr:MFS transporter [Blastocatellia bacterium]
MQEAVLPRPYEKKATPTAALIHGGFVLTGVVTTLLGPLIPILSSKWSIPDSRAGYLFTAQFLGSMGGVIGTGRVFARWGFVRPIAVGFFVVSAGIGGLGIAQWPAGLVMVFLYGLGLGVVIPGFNLLVARTTPGGKRAAALNLLNFAWGIGAVGGPPVIALLCRMGGTALPHFMLAALLGVTGLILLSRSTTIDGEINQPPESRSGAAEPLPMWPAIIIGVLIFLYVGTENSLG